MVGDGVLVGLVAGFIITTYRMCLSRAEALLRGLITQISGNPVPIVGWFVALFAMADDGTTTAYNFLNVPA